MSGFICGYGEKGPTSGVKPPGIKQALGPNTEAPLAGYARKPQRPQKYGGVMTLHIFAAVGVRG